MIKVNVVFHDQQKRILVVSSDGVKAEDLQPRSFLAATVVAEKNGRRERSGWNFGGRKEFSYFTPTLRDTLAKTAVGSDLRGQEFQGNNPAQLRVLGLEDDTHTAAAGGAQKLVSIRDSMTRPAKPCGPGHG